MMTFDENASSFTLKHNAQDPSEKYAIASHDIRSGEEILSENVLVYGPISEPKWPLCIGCSVKVDCSTVCRDCGWPICRETCDKLDYHKSNECQVFKKCNGMSFQRLSTKKTVYHQYNCVLPLRLLLLVDKTPDKWPCIDGLHSFIDLRKDRNSWQRDKNYVVKYIRQKCKLKKFDEELIHRICGIIDANSFLMSNSKNSIRCLYENVQYFSHTCLPNAGYFILFSRNFKLYMKATSDIQKGDRITFSKTETILPTLLRRQELIQNYYFSCCCLRCSDATELESHFSSLQCPKCKEGFVLSENPLDFEANWKCTSCKFQKQYTHLKKLYNQVEKELNTVKEGLESREAIEKCEKLLKKYESVFHFNHSFIVYLKYYSSLISLKGDTFSLSDFENIDAKINRLYEILKVFDIVTPGLTAMRGSIFHLFYKAYVVKAKQFKTEESRDDKKFTEYMSKALQFLNMTEEIMIIDKSSSDVSFN